ncbi:hypothetical protein D5R81_06025 [Parashewanella spongiae]|uniref:Uncharacterized protein n=1 Tax=Parashewanella spongiae TaxID=342950 RepID=A0A3A6TQK0_9GAMM|nr:hypothetical protein [Parashewanella spongiae]MCL1077541.1 hypothetical protein [Parashewanella spongiae]RJY18281.1 hypothetical protein D5R81_06025 [Parashewanella spongiae]
MLAASGFNNYQVVGFAGAVLGQNVSQYYCHGGNHDNDQHAVSVASEGLYSVNNGSFNRIIGQDWTSKHSSKYGFKKHSVYQVYKRDHSKH